MASKYEILNRINEKNGNLYDFEITCIQEAQEFGRILLDTHDSGSDLISKKDADAVLYALNNWNSLK